jgi:hypothetical protein
VETCFGCPVFSNFRTLPCVSQRGSNVREHWRWLNNRIRKTPGCLLQDSPSATNRPSPPPGSIAGCGPVPAALPVQPADSSRRPRDRGRGCAREQKYFSCLRSVEQPRYIIKFSLDPSASPAGRSIRPRASCNNDSRGPWQRPCSKPFPSNSNGPRLIWQRRSHIPIRLRLPVSHVERLELTQLRFVWLCICAACELWTGSYSPSVPKKYITDFKSQALAYLQVFCLACKKNVITLFLFQKYTSDIFCEKTTISLEKPALRQFQLRHVRGQDLRKI